MVRKEKAVDVIGDGLRSLKEWLSNPWNSLPLFFLIIVIATVWLFIFQFTQNPLGISTATVALIGTGATVSTTLVYIFLNYIIVRENIQSRHQQVAPTLIMDITESVGKVQPTIRNVGNGPALDLTLKAELLNGGPCEEIQHPYLSRGDDVALWGLHDDFYLLADTDSEVYENYETLKVTLRYISNTGKE